MKKSNIYLVELWEVEIESDDNQYYGLLYECFEVKWDEEDEYYQKINVNDTNYAKLKFNKKTYLINSCNGEHIYKGTLPKSVNFERLDIEDDYEFNSFKEAKDFIDDKTK
jgi:hypothetical protein